MLVLGDMYLPLSVYPFPFLRLFTSSITGIPYFAHTYLLISLHFLQFWFSSRKICYAIMEKIPILISTLIIYQLFKQSGDTSLNNLLHCCNCYEIAKFCMKFFFIFLYYFFPIKIWWSTVMGFEIRARHAWFCVVELISFLSVPVS